MPSFCGFQKPTENYSKLPHEFINLLPDIDSLAELKVVLYILRHTWGFSEYDKPKKITLDELQNGRKRRDGSRMDGGTGLSINSIKSGADKAVERGILTVETDETDRARIEKWYCLNMSDESNPDTRLSKVDSQPSKIDNRTEKETLERKDINAPENMPLEWYVQHDLPIPPSLTEKNLLEKRATDEFESAFSFGQLPWDSTSTWQKFKKWVVAKFQNEPTIFRDYVEWRNGAGKYQAMSNKQIRQSPDQFIDTGYPDYKAHTGMSRERLPKPL